MSDKVVEANGRLDAAVKKLFDLSWSDARRYIETGKVYVDDARVTDEARTVKAGATLALRMNVPKPLGHTDLRKESIVYLDEDVIVLDKASGLLAIPFDGEKDTLQSRVTTYLGRIEKTAKPPALGVVHRIDKDTSGLMIFTRNFTAKTSLAEQFRVHSTERSYLAIVHGQMKSDTVKSYLLGDRGDGLRGSWEQTPMAKRGEKRPRESQKAITHFNVKETLQEASLVECRLETGRTHQIRIHTSEAGHPILGEHVYIRDFKGKPLRAPRLMLHAFVLGFEHPRTGKTLRFERQPPADFDTALSYLR
jgi:23S rRNA pseudouridine1911/1915/1917 synthase